MSAGAAAPGWSPTDGAQVLLSLNFRLSAEEVRTKTTAIAAAYTAALDGIVAGQGDAAGGFAPFATLANAEADAVIASSQVTLPALTSTDTAAREASSTAKQTLREMWQEAYSRKDLFDLLQAAADGMGMGGRQQQVEAEDEAEGEEVAARRRFVIKTLEAFRQNGCTADPAARGEYAELSQRCGRLASQYEQAINEDTSTIALSREELAGCPETFITGLFVSRDASAAAAAASTANKPQSTTGGGNQTSFSAKAPAEAHPRPQLAEVSMKAPTRVPVMQYARAPETRRRVQRVADLRCVDENEPRLRELVAARMAKAALLGFPSHAEQVLQQKMVGSLAAAREFLMDIHRKLRPAAGRDREALSALKARLTAEDGTAPSPTPAPAAETESTGDAGGGGDGDSAAPAAAAAPVVSSWDGAFYARVLKEELFALDSEKVREFFPMGHVQAAIFSIYQRLLGVSFTRVPPAAAGPNVIWHEEVDLYAVTDCDTGDLCGHFYLDLYSRDGKFGHQCVVPIVPSCYRRGGRDDGAAEVVPPACAILGNMTKATAERPSLLRFAEVHTFFHEFGHVMHAVLSRTRFTRFSWTWPMMPWPGGVEQDFLEVPSMFLEKLVYESDVVAELSSHFETGARLDDATVEKLNRAQHFLAGRRWSRFIAMAIYDLEVHSQTPPYSFGKATGLDLRGLWGAVMQDLGDYEGDAELALLAETFMPASWYHLVIGYDAGYYGYLYSEVLAYSILDKFKQAVASGDNATASGGADGEAPTFESLGRRYRRCILQPCASKDGAQMLRDFLGHEPSPKAFLVALGIS